MNQSLIETLLSQAPFFEGLSTQNRALLARHCRFREEKKKTVLFYETDPGSTLWLCARGSVRLYKTSADGKEATVRTIRTGEVFGEVVLFERDRYPVTAVCVTEAQLVEIPKREIRDLLDTSSFRDDFIAMLMRKQRYLAERIQYLSSYDIEERFLRFLKEHYGRAEAIEVSMSKKDLAAAIGATPESLSRLLQRLTDAGLLEWTGRSVRLSASLWERI